MTRPRPTRPRLMPECDPAGDARSSRWSRTVREAVQAFIDSGRQRGPESDVLIAALRRADLYAARCAFGAIPRGAARVGRDVRNVDPVPVQMVLLKPVGDACNLACRYCYEAERRRIFPTKFMSETALERVLENLLPYGEGPLFIAVHGGEPLLRGRPFFEALVRRVRVGTSRDVTLGVQTNGTLVDRNWAAFFARHRFEVGLSLDGDSRVNDRDRVDRVGRGTYRRVADALHLLRAERIEPGVICVLTARHAVRPRGAARLLSALRNLGVRRFDVHPAFAPIADSADYNVSPAAYARFMIDLFEEWLGAGDPRLEIGSFEHFFQGMNGVPGAACYRAGRCTSIVGVDPGGDVIPCTRPFREGYRFGNLARQTLPEIVAGETFQSFARLELAGQQRTAGCSWALLCGRGGCPHERMEEGRQTIDGRHVYCTCASGGDGGYPALFFHLRQRVEELLSPSNRQSRAR